jgi:hypothetical protein
MKLTRVGKDVFYEGTKLTRVDQATKGPGNEVIKIDGLEGSNGAKWISLSKLKEGLNEIDVKGKIVTNSGSYTLTQSEKDEMAKLQKRIDEIKEIGRKRYQLTKPIDLTKMSIEELEAYLVEKRKIHQEQMK